MLSSRVLRALASERHRCGFCGKILKTSAGVSRHIQQVAACRHAARLAWIKKKDKHTSTTSANDLGGLPDCDESLQEGEEQNGTSHIDVEPDNIPGTSRDDDAPPLGNRRHAATVEDIPDEEDVVRWVLKYPQSAGQIVQEGGENTFERWRRESREQGTSRWHPFESEKEWQLACWLAKNVGQNQIEKFLKLGLIQTLSLSCTSKYLFNKKLAELPTTTEWIYDEITVKGDALDGDGDSTRTEVLDLWRRDPVAVIRELISNPAFRDVLTYAPERVYRDSALTQREISEMWTGDWWWDVQNELPEGATVVPVILASDKTQLSRFRGDQAAWPVYLSIGNIAKATRRQISSRAMVLVGYIPTSKLECYSAGSRSAARWQLFHHCMRKIVDTLVDAGREGVEMLCADGAVRWVFPILAAYIADHPEQCLITNVQENFCPRGTTSSEDLGSPSPCVLRNVEDFLEMINQHKEGENPPQFEAEGLRAGVYNPFWEDLPHCDIFSCITPDILHQLHKGVFKDHLVAWCIKLVGKDEVDRRFQAIPDLPKLRHFKKGITRIKQWTGSEQKEMEKVFVPLLAGAVDQRVLAAAQAIIDFTYYAQYQLHTSDTLAALHRALESFHANKVVFEELGVRDGFNMPKIHSMLHYYESILQKGGLDGFNTELPERLHIEFAKDAYRAGNQRDYIAHMALWLQRQEAIEARSAYLEWLEAAELAEEEAQRSMNVDGENSGDRNRQIQRELCAKWDKIPNQEDDESEEDVDDEADNQQIPSKISGLLYKTAKKCPFPRITLGEIHNQHAATEFLPAFADFVQREFPQSAVLARGIFWFRLYKQVQVERRRSLYVNTRTYFDRVRATAAVPQRGRKHPVPSHFDTVLAIEDVEAYRNRPRGSTSLDGTRVARVKVIFELPIEYGRIPCLLAYVEWFTPFGRVDPATNMFLVSRSTRNHRPNAAIIRTDQIIGQCSLIARCGLAIDRAWNSENVLDVAPTFSVNPYLTLELFARSELYPTVAG